MLKNKWLTKKNKLRLVVDRPDHEVAGVRVGVDEPGVEELLREDSQDLFINVGQG